MTAYALLKWTANPRTNAFHYNMFHGESGKEGEEVPDWFSHSLYDDITDHLYIIRNGWSIPDIFQPTHCNLVVSEKVKDKLEGLNNLHFCPVKFKKLINLPYNAGDFSYYESAKFLRNPHKWRPDNILKNLPDDPELHAKVSQYYELAMASHWEVLSDPKYHFTHIGSYDGKPLGYDDDIYEIRLCSEILEDYPVFSTDNGYLLNDKTIRVFRPFLDPDYFVVQKVSMRPDPGYVEDFGKYERLRNSGATADEVYKTAVRDGIDSDTQDRLLRKLFGLSLRGVKEIRLRANL